MIRQLHRDIADTIRQILDDTEPGHPRLETVAAFTRRAADLLKADDRALNYEWFFGACGLDNWGELMPSRKGER